MSLRDHGGIATSIGHVTMTVEGDRLIAVGIVQHSVPRGTSNLWRDAAAQLEQWFAGERHDFDLPLAPAATPRGAVLRQAMIAIGYGKTISYGALARTIGSSPRAIGQACARNPMPIIVPCHRVLSAGDRLGFYSAGEGPDTKAWLLSHERNVAGETR